MNCVDGAALSQWFILSNMPVPLLCVPLYRNLAAVLWPFPALVQGVLSGAHNGPEDPVSHRDVHAMDSHWPYPGYKGSIHDGVGIAFSYVKKAMWKEFYIHNKSLRRRHFSNSKEILIITKLKLQNSKSIKQLLVFFFLYQIQSKKIRINCQCFHACFKSLLPDYLHMKRVLHKPLSAGTGRNHRCCNSWTRFQSLL